MNTSILTAKARRRIYLEFMDGASVRALGRRYGITVKLVNQVLREGGK